MYPSLVGCGAHGAPESTPPPTTLREHISRIMGGDDCSSEMVETLNKLICESAEYSRSFFLNARGIKVNDSNTLAKLLHNVKFTGCALDSLKTWDLGSVRRLTPELCQLLTYRGLGSVEQNAPHCPPGSIVSQTSCA